MLDFENIKWNDQGLIPAILQDHLTGQVLMLGYMDKQALEKTVETKDAWFFSRSRNELWHKGETSGNYQRVLDMCLDCDNDTLLLQVEPMGHTCHLDRASCFGEGSEPVLEKLKNTLAKRYEERPEKSYTTYLFTEGIDKILKKVGEESAEVIIGAKNNDPVETSNESADLLYHLMVMFENQKISYKDVMKVLKERMK